MKLRTFLTATALALASVVAPIQPADAAMPVAPLVAKGGAMQAQPVHGPQNYLYWRHNRPYWNGYPGYRYRRPGYRYYGGYWFPPGAFNIIIVPPANPPTYQLTERHYRWCEHRYRSYRRWDNSFQPYHGPRRPCVSPYLRRIR